MKTNVNNTAEKYTKKAVEALKSEIKANDIETLELTKFGIQVYAAYLDDSEYIEYYVVTKAERDLRTGRYFFITREGVRLAWSRLAPETLIVAAVDFLDAIESEEKRAAETLDRLENYGMQHVESRFFFLYVRPLLDTMGTPYHIEATGFNDLGETIDVVAIDPADRVPTWDTIEAAPSRLLESMKADRLAKSEKLHAAGYYAAARVVSQLSDLISETQEKRREAAERADRIEADREANKSAEFVAEWSEKNRRRALRYAARLIGDGATVTEKQYYIEVYRAETLARVTIDTADRRDLADLLTRKAAAAEVVAADCRARGLDSAAESFTVRAARYLAAAVTLDPLTPAPTPQGEGEAVTIETPAPETIEGEKGDTIADTIKGAAAKVAGLVLLAVTLTTGTADTIATTDTPDVAEILTTDPAAELVALRAAGLTVTRYDIKTAPATINGEAPTC